MTDRRLLFGRLSFRWLNDAILNVYVQDQPDAIFTIWGGNEISQHCAATLMKLHRQAGPGAAIEITATVVYPLNRTFASTFKKAKKALCEKLHVPH